VICSAVAGILSHVLHQDRIQVLWQFENFHLYYEYLESHEERKKLKKFFEGLADDEWRFILTGETARKD